MDGGDLTDLRWLSTMNLRVSSLDPDEAAARARAQTALSSILAELEALPADAVESTARAPCSFAALVALALAHAPNGKMTLGEICAWIARTFAFFSLDQQSSWKASVRQSLSSTKIFARAGPASKSATCPWTLIPSACDAIATRAPILAPRRALIPLSPLQVRKRSVDMSSTTNILGNTSASPAKRTRRSTGLACRASRPSHSLSDEQSQDIDVSLSVFVDSCHPDLVFDELSASVLDFGATPCSLFAESATAPWDATLLSII